MNRKMEILLGKRQLVASLGEPSVTPEVTAPPVTPEVTPEAGLPADDQLVDGVIQNPNPTIEEAVDAEIEHTGETAPAEAGVAPEAADQKVKAPRKRKQKPSADVVDTKDETKP